MIIIIIGTDELIKRERFLSDENNDLLYTRVCAFLDASLKHNPRTKKEAIDLRNHLIVLLITGHGIPVPRDQLVRALSLDGTASVTFTKRLVV